MEGEKEKGREREVGSKEGMDDYVLLQWNLLIRTHLGPCTLYMYIRREVVLFQR